MAMQPRDTADDIAIVGMAGNFPGAPTLDKFWADLCAGRDGITRMTREELLDSGVSAELADDPAFVAAAGMLPDIDRFDAEFFGYDRADAELLDPQHRLFLECAWHALEDAGIDPDGVEGLAAVFTGGAPSTYLMSNLLQNDVTALTVGPDQLILQNEKDLLASRLSFALDFTGPSVSVQSCSSTGLSVVAQACSSLLTGESDLAVAGGVSVVVPQEPGYLYRSDSRFAPDGVNRILDAEATGKVPGNGLGVIVLRRLEDAQSEGDRVYAVIRGWAIHHEGRQGRQSFNRPGVPGQAAVVAEAMAAADVEPSDIDHVEVSTLGTPFGDVAEIAALQRIFDVEDVEQVTLGSIDANLGHINQAGGIARLIKAALALYHEELPPAINFERPNPQFAHSGDKLVVPREPTAWPRGGRPRLAGVSANGFGGTDAHVVLEEAPEPEPAPRPAARPHQLLVWSARTAEAAAAAGERLAADRENWTDLADVAYTLQTGRKTFAHRRMAVVSSPEDAAEVFAAQDTRILAEADSIPRRAGFLLPGVGEQYRGMAGGLYESEPEFKAAVDECAALFAGDLGSDPTESLRGPRADGGGELARLLGRAADTEEAGPALTQPAVFTLGYALGRLLRAWGIEPSVLAGYSVGEFAAAALAGALTLEEATELVAFRARLIEKLSRGAMSAVPLGAAELTALVGDPAAFGVDIAAINGPQLVVVSGAAEGMTGLTDALAEHGVPARPLRTTHAFHSRTLRPVAAELTAWARQHLNPQEPDVPYLSNLTGAPITAKQLRDPGYWAEHMCRPVQFAAMIEHAASALPDTVLLELGAGQSLGAMFRGHPDFPQESWRLLVPTLPGEADPRPDTEVLAGALGRCWLSGVELDWRAYHEGRQPRKTTVPGYVFGGERYWIEPTAARSATEVALGAREADAARPQPVYLVEGPVDRTARDLAIRLGSELGATVVFAAEHPGGAEAVRAAHGRLDGVLDLTMSNAAESNAAKEER
ncbi:type I polyketide synthase [Sciscionella marina]|uniref:type I polyketide synthase n=1 Tax=Sciscionella marina TaxID=508770 RepID=UPI0003AA1494|nr:type I polyketide synthase [Sciscionella marina]